MQRRGSRPPGPSPLIHSPSPVSRLFPPSSAIDINVVPGNPRGVNSLHSSSSAISSRCLPPPPHLPMISLLVYPLPFPIPDGPDVPSPPGLLRRPPGSGLCRRH